jgi:hypothetical protein
MWSCTYRIANNRTHNCSNTVPSPDHVAYGSSYDCSDEKPYDCSDNQSHSGTYNY